MFSELFQQEEAGNLLLCLLGKGLPAGVAAFLTFYWTSELKEEVLRLAFPS